MKIAVQRECDHREQRVALIPTDVKRLTQQGLQVEVETSAGLGAGYEDEEYSANDAVVSSEREKMLSTADIVLGVRAPLRKKSVFFETAACP